MNFQGTHMGEKHDYWSTPESAVAPLIPLLPRDKVIWECTDTYGESGITSGLRKAGFTVEASSQDEIDFLKQDVTGWDVVVTNPPYSIKEAFIEKCIGYGKPFALLLPLTALEGLRRGRLWRAIEAEFGLLVLDRRTQFGGNDWARGNCYFNTSWFCRGLFHGVRFYEVQK
jgi:hypothetical protein